MHPCPCGDPAKDAGHQCARCAAVRTLDLPFQATEDEIAEAYHAFVKAWHPDRFQHDETLRKAAEEKMRDINAAYHFLTLAPANGPKPPHEQPTTADKTPTEPGVPRSFPNRLQILFRSLPRPRTLMAIAGLVGGLSVAGFLSKTFDSYLLGEPVVGEQYSNFKAFVGEKLRDVVRSTWNNTGEGFRSLISGRSSPEVEAAAKSDAAADSTGPGNKPHTVQRYELRTAESKPVKASPYITAGLTKAEVIAIQGDPTLLTEDKLTYARTEFYFSDDKLAGWKIDPASVPARVKLWPQSAVDPSLQSFTLGSTKDQVLAIQGTPTVFSEDTFGYGGSEVYFQNDQVIGWKDDRASVPLRATAR